MRVATIISVYAGDSPELFGRAIASVFEQRLKDSITSRVYLAIDGFVSGGIENVVSEFGENFHKVVRIEENQGLAHALNELIGALEDEELVFRMDSDDISHPDRYQIQIEYLVANPEVDILGTDIVESDSEMCSSRIVRFYYPPNDVRKHLCFGVPVAHPSVCMRRSVFDRVGLYPTSGTNEDIAMWFKCARAGLRFDNIPLPLLEFTVGKDFWSRRSFKKSIGELKCYISGVYGLFGLTWRFIFPFARFMLRLAPKSVVQFAYELRAQKRK